MTSGGNLRPLDGVKILDLTRHMAGPYATVFLSDYGADIIKIESLPHGDPSRSTGVKVQGKVSATFLMWNRGKRGLALDLRRRESIEVVRRLAASADVLIENYKPGTTDTMGLGYAALSAINPRLIYVSVSAFGKGPLEPYPGTDPVIQAMSGVMSVTGESGGAPVLVGVPMADFTGAMMGSQAVMLGLLAREKTGVGQHIDVSMLHSLMFSLTTRLAHHWASGVDPKPNGAAHSVVMPYQAWQTADGYVVAGVWNGAEVMWPKFCDAIGLPDLAGDARYSSNALRLQHRDELATVLQAEFLRHPTRYWEQRFHERGVLFGPVHKFSEVLNHPHVVQAGIVGSVEHPLLGAIPQLRAPVDMHATPGRLDLPPPLLGEHTVAILREAGYQAAEIEALLNGGIAAAAEAPARSADAAE